MENKLRIFSAFEKIIPTEKKNSASLAVFEGDILGIVRKTARCIAQAYFVIKFEKIFMYLFI